MKLRVQIGRRRQAAASGPETLKAPLTASMILHGVLFGLVLFGGLLVTQQRGEVWGSGGNGGGDAVPVNLAPSVPLPPSTAPENPLASATKENFPIEKQQPKQVAPPPQPSARELQLAEKDFKKKLKDLERQQAQRELAQLSKQREIPENAIPGTTSSGRASSTMYGMATAQGAAGFGFGEFGSLYGWYASQVKTCIARHWDRSRVDPSIRSAPRVYIEFDILRDGSFRGERLATSSTIPSIDREALRAVQACSGRSDVGADAHLPELPRDYSGSSVHVEVWFEFKK